MHIKEFFVRYIYLLVGKVMRLLYSPLPLENKVVFTAYSGLRYDCNPRAISDKLHQLRPDIKQIWLMKDVNTNVIPEYVTIVRYGSMRMFRELLTAKVWVDNGTKSLWVSKRKEQFFIQTWHGGLGFKKMGSDSPFNYGYLDRARDVHSYSMTDVFLSNSKWMTQLYSRIHPYYKGVFWECGFPRNDIFFDKQLISTINNKVRAELGIDKDTYVVLYAPTFRVDGLAEHYMLDFDQIITSLESITHKDVCILVKLHHWSESLADSLYKYNQKVRNVTSYPNMQMISIASDCFITDYSSGIFDFAILDRPAFLYADDYDHYLSQERGLYFDLRDMPFPFSDSSTSLIANMVDFGAEEYHQKLEAFWKETGFICAPNASTKVCELIEKRMENR